MGDRKRNTKKINENGDTKRWKATGPEQNALQEMFRNGSISEADSPAKIRKMNPLFGKFTAKVFGAHFNSIKAKEGFFASNFDDCEDECSIAELDSLHTSSLQIKGLASDIQFSNAPHVVWTYTDHVKKCTFVCVSVSIFAGSKNTTFVPSVDGMSVEITYTWPSTIINASALFKDELNDEDSNIDVNHPKLHALTTHLLDHDMTEKSKPVGKIVINLPCKVLREIGTYKKKKIQNADGTNIILLQFRAYQKATILNDADNSIVFD